MLLLLGSAAFVGSMARCGTASVPGRDLDASTNISTSSRVPASLGAIAISLPYRGKWDPAASDGLKSVSSDSTHWALIKDASATEPVKDGPLALAAFDTVVDSGCSGSLTDDCRRLTNIRSCNEVFGQANGHVAVCNAIGDMPVVVKNASGRLLNITFSNVRCVPGFKFTLLSVRQLWEEQRIDARFRDLNHLQLPNSAGGHVVPYAPGSKLGKISMVSLARLGSAGAFASSTAAGGAVGVTAAKTNAKGGAAQSALLGFHKPQSTAHIEHMSAALAGALMERRLHQGAAKIRALHHVTKGAPRNLTSAPVVPCEHCAAGKIKRSSHSSSLDDPAPQPGVLHMDLKQLPISVGGYQSLRRLLHRRVHALRLLPPP